MKNIWFIAIGGAMLVGCASEDYLGDARQTGDNTELISFDASSPAMTRSSLSGSAAADKLGNRFVVYATKHNVAELATSANDIQVMNNYQVKWEDNTANTTASNTNNWDYYNLGTYDKGVTQDIKYWDYNADNGYTFYAFASKNISCPAASSDKIGLSKITSSTDIYSKGYNVVIKNGADFSNLYFSDREVVDKDDFGKPVQFNFQSFGAKVRVGFYETIPGYTVKIKRFYYDKDATSPVVVFDNMTDYQTPFCASLQNVITSGRDNKLSIFYTSSGDAINKPYATYTDVKYNYTLTLGKNVYNTVLGTTAATATYDQTDGAYTNVYPLRANGNPMLLRCDYEITSEESNAETLTISGAKVVIPAQYVQWNSNCCYTYLFRISMNSNGTTGTSGTDPDGLYPIQFDAYGVTTGSDDQTNLTDVDNFNVTTFRVGSDVYITCMSEDGKTLCVPENVGDLAGQAQMYEVTTTGETISEASAYARLTGTSNGLQFTALHDGADFAAKLVYQVPATDGTYYTFGTEAKPGALKFTSESGHCYAYVYCKTKHADAIYAKAGDTYDSTQTYYVNNSGTYSVTTVADAADFATKKDYLYVLHTAAVKGDYAVMILDTRG